MGSFENRRPLNVEQTITSRSVRRCRLCIVLFCSFVLFYLHSFSVRGPVAFLCEGSHRCTYQQCQNFPTSRRVRYERRPIVFLWKENTHAHSSRSSVITTQAACSVGLLLPGQWVVVLDSVDGCQAKPNVVQISLKLDPRCQKFTRFNPSACLHTCMEITSSLCVGQNMISFYN